MVRISYNTLIKTLLLLLMFLDIMHIEKPTKCVTSRKLIEINAQVQFIDFEGRSDGESLLKILSQLRPRRVVVVRGSEDSVMHISKHCQQNIGSRVFTPARGEVRRIKLLCFILLVNL